MPHQRFDRPTVPPAVSFVVPTHNSARTIDACLESIVGQSDVEAELVVIDNHSTDRTVELSQAWTQTIETLGPERCAQRNWGAQLTSAEVIIFIDSDMVLDPGIARSALEAFERDRALGAIVIPERSFGSGPWIGTRRLEKDTYLGDPEVEAARIFRRDVFQAVGRYDEALVAGEDWDLADRVVGAGYHIGRVASVVWHDEGRISLRESFAKKRYYGRTFGSYRARQGQRRSVGLRRIRPFVGELFRSPLRAGGLIVLKVVEAVGFAMGAHDTRRQARQ